MPVNDRLAHLATLWPSRRISEGLPTAASLLADIVLLKRTIFYLELALLIGLFSFELNSQYRDIRAREREEVNSLFRTAVDKPHALLKRMGMDERAKLEQDDASLRLLKSLPLPAIVQLEDYTAATVSLGNTRLLAVGDEIDTDLTPSRLFPALLTEATAPPSDGAVRQALAEPLSRWFWHQGVLYHASAGPLTGPLPASRFRTGEPGSGAMILMFVHRFDQERLSELAGRFDLPPLNVAEPGHKGFNNGVAILDRDDEPIAAIAWESRLRGSVHLLEMCLLAAMIVLTLFGIGQYMSRRIRALGKQIDRIHAINARDRARLRSLIEAANDGLMVLDSKGTILDINQAVTRRSGYTRADLVGKIFSELAPHLPLEDPDFLSGRNTVRSEVKCKDGEIYWVDIGISTLEDEITGDGRYIVVSRDVTKRVQQEQEIWHKAHYDSLTDLPNRSLFMTRLNGDLMHALEMNSECVLMFVDLDGFKLVNDTHGHEAGDDLLIAVAERFRETVSPDIMVARLGGDEFGVAMPAGTLPKQAQKLAKDLTRSLSRPFDLNGSRVRISASIGIAIGPTNARTASELMRAADKAMYQAKRHMRGGYRMVGDAEPNDGQRALKRYM